MCLGCDSDAISHFGVSTRFFGEPSARFVGEISMRFIGEASTRFSSEVPTRFIGEVSTRFESPEQPYGPSELSLGRILGHSSNHRSKLAVLQTSLRETRNSRRLLKPRVARTSGLFLSHRESSGWTASHRTSDLAFRYRSDLAFRDRSDFALRESRSRSRSRLNRPARDARPDRAGNDQLFRRYCLSPKQAIPLFAETAAMLCGHCPSYALALLCLPAL